MSELTPILLSIVAMFLGLLVVALGIYIANRTPNLEETEESLSDWKEFEVWRELEKDAPKMGEGFGRWLGATVARERSERVDAESALEALQEIVTEQGVLRVANERVIDQQAKNISCLLDNEERYIEHLRVAGVEEQQLNNDLLDIDSLLQSKHKENDILIRKLAETSDKLREADATCACLSVDLLAAREKARGIEVDDKVTGFDLPKGYERDPFNDMERQSDNWIVSLRTTIKLLAFKKTTKLEGMPF